MSSYFSKIPSLRFQWPWNPHLSKVSLALLVLVIMLCSWFTGTLPMVSNSTDIHPTPEGTKLRDQVTSSRATWSQRWPTMRWVATFFLFFRGFVLLLPLFIHIKLSVSEMASCTFYYNAIRSCTCVFYEQSKKRDEIKRYEPNTNSPQVHKYFSVWPVTCDLWPVTCTLAPPWFRTSGIDITDNKPGRIGEKSTSCWLCTRRTWTTADH